MARGLVSGLFVGAVVSVGALGVASVLSPLPESPRIAAAPGAVDAPGAGADPDTQSDVAPRGPDADLAEIAPTTPTEQSQSDDLNAISGADTDPAARPAVEAETAGLGDPSPAGQSPTVPEATASAAQPVATDPGLPAPQPSEAPISQVPTQPTAPEAEGTALAEAPETEPAETPAEAPAETPAAEAETTDETVEAPAEQQPSVQQPAQPPAPRLAALPQSGSEPQGGGIGTPVRPLTERDDAPAAAASVPAIEAHGQGFDNPDGKPLMSIVLIDDAQGFGAEALQDFPYPLTFALDPADPDAIEKLDRYRAAGFEVALLTDLAASATAQDAEVAMEAAMAALPEIVALIEGVGAGFQGNRGLSDQITAIALGGGYGLVTQSKGLNTVQKLAARKGVPSAVVFRDFDGAGQNPDTIRRFLDQAAFRADQEGAVVMLGRVRPDTISALLLWGLQDRASRVALSPLSAALLRPAE